jgi:drug/metabolite transporter (DMT)-like permease
VLLATIYALAAALLHTGWNLMAKRSVDPLIALWGQFLLAGIASAALLAVTRDLPAEAWIWAGASGIIHVPYVVGLGWAYRHGDFSLAYPLARGGGALVAAVGGIVLLGDNLHIVSVAAIALMAIGMAMLSAGAARHHVVVALLVAASIGSYTLVDSHAARRYDSATYVFAVFAMIALAVTITGLAAGRGRALAAVSPVVWRQMALAAGLSVATYGLVLLAVRRAPVGYVAALRESSVLMATLIGWRLLGERRGRGRSAAAVVIISGLVLLVGAR